ncbi:MAG: response regulator [Gammaproteobacteria bacterium]|nr:response regulator [Gammaproteobacteria bacterium]MDH5650675.1 response regulator [Gammaproteobacteria bacterium]
MENPAAKSKHVLVVDDAIFIRNFIRTALKMADIVNIREAADGREALGICQHRKFDLIISDWHMPNMNGLELLQAIRADERTHDTPFLMLTSDVSKENVTAAIKSGVSDYLAKPFRHDPLIIKVSRLLNVTPVTQLKVIR